MIFFGKLAVNNIKKNDQIYIPYIIACTGCIFIYFIFASLIKNPGMTNIPDSQGLKLLFQIGKNVSMVFVSIFIFYANSFLMKQRNKELALYGILGLEKRHVAKMMFYETIIIAAISLFVAMIFGMVLGQLFFLILLKLIHLQEPARLYFTGDSVFQTVGFFALIFLGTFLWNFIQVKMSDPISLLKSGQSGEREPKASIIITTLGVITLGTGYYLAWTAKSAMASIVIFFLAVILVVIGIYLVFTSGSIFLLKVMKRTKRYYYKPENFISVSNMMYRMKKNAVGLASICLLSTMVIITIGSTFVLYQQEHEIIKARSPYNIMVTIEGEVKNQGEVAELVRNIAQNHQVEIIGDAAFYSKSIQAVAENGKYIRQKDAKVKALDLLDITDRTTLVEAITMDQYRELTGADLDLGETDIALYTKKTYDANTIGIFGKEYNIKKRIEKIPYVIETKKQQVNLFNGDEFFVVMSSEDQLNQLVINEGNLLESEVTMDQGDLKYRGDIKGTKENKLAFAEELRNHLYEKYQGVSYASYDIYQKEWGATYGGLLFLGVFLGLLFTCAFVLIIYFKQVQEGYEDRDRFLLLEKVGMDQDSVKKTIFTQIRLVFLLPIAAALINTIVAQPVLQNLLRVFGLTDQGAISLGMMIVSGVFLLLYLMVYLMTARVYKKIIAK